MAHHARTLIAAAALLMLSPGCGPGAGAPVTGATQSLVLEPRPVEIVLGFTGRISPGDRADLLAPYEGVIETLHVHVGDRVAAGDPLVTLNPADLQRERAQAEAALLRAEADAAELEKFTRKVAKQTRKMGCELVEYDGPARVWKFKVPSFQN